MPNYNWSSVTNNINGEALGKEASRYLIFTSPFFIRHSFPKNFKAEDQVSRPYNHTSMVLYILSFTFLENG
jgi:hypothetical protein